VSKPSLILSGVIAAALALALSACSGGEEPAANLPRTVLVAPVTASEGGNALAIGTVRAGNQAMVAAAQGGRVLALYADVGARVTQGQVLARLDAASAQADDLVATRGLEAARRNLREIEVRLADAQKTLDRNRNLVQRQLVSQSALDASEAEVAALGARLAAARAEVGVAEARVAVTQQGLDDLSIRAPFAGVVISKDAQPGETVSPISAGGGFTRTGIATIVDMDSREIEVDVNEAYINRVHDDQRVEAVLDAYPDWKVPGHVISIVPTADRQKATVRVRIAFDQLDARILPDMGIKVRFLEESGGGPVARPTVPENAVLRDGGTTAVWVVRDGKVERRAVEVGAPKDGRVTVEKGLEGGESVVIDPPRRLREGSAVELEAS